MNVSMGMSLKCPSVVPFDVIRPAIDVFLAVWAVEHAYQLVLWVLRKVPILGIK